MLNLTSYPVPGFGRVQVWESPLSIRMPILTYEMVLKAPKPDEILLQFLKSTYEAAGINGNWDKKALERSS